MEKPVPYICSQKSHNYIHKTSFQLCVFSLDLVTIKSKTQNFDASLCLYGFYGTLCAVKIKEPLVLEFDKKRSKNKEFLKLGLELGSL